MAKKKNPEKGIPRLAIVEWLDAFDGPTGWISKDRYKVHPIRPCSVGWIIEEMLDDHVNLVGTFLVDRNDESSDFISYSNPAHIPAGMVQSITYIDLPASIVQLMLNELHTRGSNAD
jgi:hypothetical protein